MDISAEVPHLRNCSTSEPIVWADTTHQHFSTSFEEKRCRAPEHECEMHDNSANLSRLRSDMGCMDRILSFWHIMTTIVNRGFELIQQCCYTHSCLTGGDHAVPFSRQLLVSERHSKLPLRLEWCWRHGRSVYLPILLCLP